MNKIILPSEQELSYGILDVDKNFFYIVDSKKHIINVLQNCLKPLTSVSLVPMHLCSNWYSNKIDNEICWQWGLSNGYQESFLQSLKSNEIFLIQQQHMINDQQKQIIDNLHVAMALLSKLHSIGNMFADPRSHNHDKIAVWFARDPWISQAIQIESAYFNNYQSQWTRFVDDCKAILKELDMRQADFGDKINEMVKSLAQNSALYFNHILGTYD